MGNSPWEPHGSPDKLRWVQPGGKPLVLSHHFGVLFTFNILPCSKTLYWTLGKNYSGGERLHQKAIPFPGCLSHFLLPQNTPQTAGPLSELRYKLKMACKVLLITPLQVVVPDFLPNAQNYVWNQFREWASLLIKTVCYDESVITKSYLCKTLIIQISFVYVSTKH